MLAVCYLMLDIITSHCSVFQDSKPEIPPLAQGGRAAAAIPRAAKVDRMATSGRSV